MEIISFVQDKPAVRKVTLPVFSFKRAERSEKHSKLLFEKDFFTTELNSFSVKKVSGPVSFKIFLMELGHGITEAIHTFTANSKRIFLALMIAITAAAGLRFAMMLYSENLNFTGPLKLHSADSSYETLNRLMSEFALESFSEVDDSGNLISTDSAVSSKIYTQPVSFQKYTVQNGDTISGIAKKFGLSNVSTLISVNDISNVRQLGAGQKLKIPSIDGIVYTVKNGDTLSKVVEKNNVSLKQLLDVNELNSEVLTVGQQLFLPGAILDQQTLKNAMGDRFLMPIQAKFRWSSPYGARIDPIAGVKSFHTGTDMACPTGTPILAAMSGKVITTGVNRIYGNYVIIDHGNGYQTLYAHMSKIIAAKGQWVSQGTRIGLVGSTGYSTGPHLHFTVYKNGKMINPMTVLK